MANSSGTGLESTQSDLALVLRKEPFKGLQAILDSLSRSPEALTEALHGTNSYEALLAKLGYRLTLTRQIHVQDAYAHTGPAGGIKFVLPYYDIPTHSSFPTLVLYDSTVTTTPRAAEFFDRLLAEVKKQLTSG